MRFTPSLFRLLSTETRAAIDQAVASKPVVLFMKGTPETPQCGFSRASIQILGLQGVDPEKFSAFNVLEDEELRQGAYRSLLDFGFPTSSQACADPEPRSQGVLGLAYDTTAVRRKGVRRRM